MTDPFGLGLGDCWSPDGDPKKSFASLARYEKYRAFALSQQVSPLYWNYRYNTNDPAKYSGTAGYDRGTLYPFTGSIGNGLIANAYYALKGYDPQDESYKNIFKSLPVPEPTSTPTPTATPVPTLEPEPTPIPTVAPPEPPFSEVQNLRVLAVHPTEIELTWDEVWGEDHYRIEFSTNDGVTWALQEDTPADHGFHATVTVRINTRYWFRVIAVYPQGESSPSNVVIATTPSGRTAAPTNLHLLAVGPMTAEFAWDEVDGETSYTMQFSTDGGFTWFKSEDVPADHAYQDTVSLQKGVSYLFRVVANTNYGPSEPSNVVAVSAASDAVQNLRVVATRSTEVELAWNEVEGESSYTVQISTTGTGSWRKAEDVPANHAYKDTVSVQPGKIYWFRVIANFPSGPSSPSNVVQATTPK